MQPAKEPSKPWPVSMFETLRPHMTNFVRNQIAPTIDADGNFKKILVHAPVKCGKREMVEYIAQRDSVQPSIRMHAFISAWHRIADEEQRVELQQHNLSVFSIITQRKVDDCQRWISHQIATGKMIVLHLDECDYGTGSFQKLSQIWKKIGESNAINGNAITVILYSATPEEVLFSGQSENEDHQITDEFIMNGITVNYIPPMGYCGPAAFLENGLVHEAIPFFNKDGLTSQGKQIASEFIENIKLVPHRNIIVLRLSYSDADEASDGPKTKKSCKQNKAIYQFLQNIGKFPELSGFLVLVDKSDDMGIKQPQIITEKIKWSKKNYWMLKTTGIPIVIVIDQTSSRSTEWLCHDRIYCTHDFRNKVQFSTMSQAQERVNHYAARYGGFQKIMVYGHVRTFQLSAKLINYETYLKDYEWKKKKIDVRISPTDMYRVHNNGVLHPNCPETGLSNIDATYLLQTLGCYADLSLSARVAGSMRSIPTYTGKWMSATKDSWNAEWEKVCTDNKEFADLKNVRNPFIAAELHRLPNGIWQGQHRGWKRLKSIGDELHECDPETGVEFKKLDLGSTGGHRIKICYNEKEDLGVFIVRQIGTRKVNTLSTFNSMYKR
jgi:hypothetical protein